MKELNYMECVAVTGATNSDATSGKPSGDKDPVPANVRDNLNNSFNSPPKVDFGFSAHVDNKGGSTTGSATATGTLRTENWKIEGKADGNTNNHFSGTLSATYYL